MKIGFAKTKFFLLNSLFIAAFFWACSESVEATNPLPQEDPIAASDTLSPQPLVPSDTENLVDPSEVTKDTAAKDSVVKDTVAKETVEKESAVEDTLTKDTVTKDTIFRHDTLIVYKDTIYDTLYDTLEYRSFVYRSIGEKIDTVIGISAIECSVDEEGRLACQKKEASPIFDCCSQKFDFWEFVKYDSANVVVARIDTNTVYIHITDTVYADTLRLNKNIHIYDTLLYNYGDNRLTDYIPPDHIDVASIAPFDSSEMRAILDTLDFSNTDEIKIAGVQSKLTFNGLPVTSKESIDRFPHESAIKLYRIIKWPEEREVSEMFYTLEPADVTSDTTVTWTLGYTYYEKGIEKNDSIQVTTFLKVEQDSKQENLDVYLYSSP